MTSSENILLAVFHRLNKIVSEKNLEDRVSAAFESYAKNGYGYSAEFQDNIVQFLIGGSVIRDTSGAIRSSAHTRGPYGRKIYESLTIEEKSKIDLIVNNIESVA